MLVLDGERFRVQIDLFWQLRINCMSLCKVVALITSFLQYWWILLLHLMSEIVDEVNIYLSYSLLFIIVLHFNDVSCTIN